MALARLTSFVPLTPIKSADVGGEINQILNLPIQLISPTSGPINFNLVAHTNLLPGVITASSGSIGQALVVSSSGGTVFGTPTLVHYNLDLRTSGVTIANTTVETTMYSVTIPGGTFQGGSRQAIIDIFCTKQAASVTSSNAITYRTYVGGVQPITSGLSNTWTGVTFNGATTGPEEVLIELSINPGGTSSQMFLLLNGNAFFSGVPFGTGLLTSIDWSADQKVDITAQWSSASASNSFVVKAVSNQVF